MAHDPPLRPDVYRNFKRWPTKKLEALLERLVRMPETDEQAGLQADPPDPALVYCKSDPRWAELQQSIVKELEPRRQGALRSRQGSAGLGKVKGPKF
jgi:hypothetical protein